MIINAPVVEKEGNKIRVSSFIEVETRKDYSDTLWYEFESDYEEGVSQGVNGFVSAMLFLAMMLGEDIDARGSMSPKLAYGLKEFQRYFSFWHPDLFTAINIRCSGYEAEEGAPDARMCTFSGGVDSFYTLFQHLPENEHDPEHQLTHCLLIDGFAIPRSEAMNDSYQKIRASYEEMTANYGIEFVFVTTNLADFYHRRIGPAQIDGAILASVPLVLGRMVSAFHIASCLTYAQVLPRGSNVVTNSLLSTETLMVTMHGSDQTRVGKTLAIAHWAEIHDKLRVCWDDVGVSNCCECEKCVRTMITLEAAGVLSSLTTFSRPLERKMIRRWPLWEKHNTWYAREIAAYAKAQGRNTIVFDVRYALVRSWILRTVFWQPSAWLKKKSSRYKQFVDRVKGN